MATPTFRSPAELVSWLAQQPGLEAIGQDPNYWDTEITQKLNPAEAAGLQTGGTLSDGTVGFWLDKARSSVNGPGASAAPSASSAPAAGGMPAMTLPSMPAPGSGIVDSTINANQLSQTARRSALLKMLQG